MKKPNYNSNIFYVCIVAILCYTFLNGHQIALEMQEKEQFESLSKIISGMSRMTGGEFVSRQLAATVAHIANYDVTVANHTIVQVAEYSETSPAQASNMPEDSPAIQENTPPDTADSSAPAVAAKTQTPMPATEHTAMQAAQGSTQSAAEIGTRARSEAGARPDESSGTKSVANTDASSGVATGATPPSSAPAAQAGKAPNKSVEEPAKASSDKGLVEDTNTNKRQTTGKSIFAKPLSHRYKVLLVGDSFMEDITLAIMRNYYNKDPNVQFISVAKHSTGLCVSTNWNWPKKLEEFMQKHKPDVVLFFLGANDLQNIFDGERRYSFTSAEWKKKYVEIAENMIDIARKGNAVPIWIGLPIMSEVYAKWVPLISELQHKACTNRNIEYVDTVPTLADENGQYQVFMKTPSGEMVRIRKADKYHVEYAGSLMIIEQVVPSIKKCILEKEKVYEFALPAGSPQASR